MTSSVCDQSASKIRFNKQEQETIILML